MEEIADFSSQADVEEIVRNAVRLVTSDLIQMTVELSLEENVPIQKTNSALKIRVQIDGGGGRRREEQVLLEIPGCLARWLQLGSPV